MGSNAGRGPETGGKPGEESVFLVRDSLQRSVFLAKSTYQQHILVGHPEVKVPATRNTVRDADCIFHSSQSNDCNVYVKSGVDRAHPSMSLKVVVRVPDPASGEVISAWVVRRLSTSDTSGGMLYDRQRDRKPKR